MSDNKILWITIESYGKTGVGEQSNIFINELSKNHDIENIHLFRFNTQTANNFLKTINRLLNLLLMMIANPLYLYFYAGKFKYIVLELEHLAPLVKHNLHKTISIFNHVPYEKDERLHCKQTLFSRLRSSHLSKANACSLQSKQLVAISNFTKEKLIEKYGLDKNKITVIHSPISLENTNEPINDEILQYFTKDPYSNKKKLLYVGSETERKNFESLLKLMHQLNDDYILIKVGRPEYQHRGDANRQYVKDHNLPVYFIEQVSDSELRYLYENSWAYLNPSLYEGFGRTPVEAQLCGLPVISTHGGSLAEVLEDSCILIKDPYNIQDYVNAIKSLENEDIRRKLIEKGYRNSERFSVEKLSQKWIDLLQLKAKG